MALTTPKMGLRVWDQLSDPYDHNQLADNWAKVDQHDHSPGRGVLIPTEGIADQAITQSKISNSVQFITPDGSVTTAKLAAGAVTPSKLGDDPTSWVALSLTAGATAATYVPSARLEGGVVRLKGKITFTSGFASNTTFATIPTSNMFPTTNVLVSSVLNGASISPVSVIIQSTGVIQTSSSTISTGNSLYLDGITFTIE